MAGTAPAGAKGGPAEGRRVLAPLALAQFICSFAGSNMNVMINDITHDLDTTVAGVQATITLFLVVMAVLMIPCSKLSDRWGRKRCFIAGLITYGIGALLSAAAPGLGVLVISHDLPRILKAADTVTVLWRGETVLDTPAQDLTVPDLVATMVGYRKEGAA